MAMEALNETLPDQGRWAKVLPLQKDSEDGSWSGQVQDSKERVQMVRYSPHSGLEFGKGP
jgi:hypothetical protein